MGTATKEKNDCLSNADKAWFDEIRREVDFECSFCEAVLKDVSELETVAARAYAFTARSMKGLYDVSKIAERWAAMFVFASELLSAAQSKRDAHQICGVDLSKLEHYRQEALYRLEIHCPA
jgi:hypothetical protein